MNSKESLGASEIAKNRQLRFWLFQLCGWFPVALILIPIFGEDNFLSLHALLFTFSVTTLAIFISTRLRLVYQYIDTKVLKSSLWVLLIIMVSFFSAMLVDTLHYTFWFIIAQLDVQYKPLYQNQPYFVLTGLLLFVYIFWSGLYLALTKQEKLNHLTIKQHQLELLVKDNKIKSLLEQLNPHFMFNTINNIRSLILQDTDKARDMLLSFADIMRYQINSNDDALVPLEEELSFVMEFIQLNRLQLGKRLMFSSNIDSALLKNVIPRMALQLLVENAIKHGLNQSAKPASLQLTVATEPTIEKPQAWSVAVKNEGTLNHNKSNSGIGLKNLDARLKLSFENNYELTLLEENETVECKILFNY
jgi:sensor histidine kinase YesM